MQTLLCEELKTKKKLNGSLKRLCLFSFPNTEQKQVKKSRIKTPITNIYFGFNAD